jgi:hypothetical protein
MKLSNRMFTTHLNTLINQSLGVISELIITIISPCCFCEGDILGLQNTSFNVFFQKTKILMNYFSCKLYLA